MKTDRPIQILLVEDNPDEVMITLRALSNSNVESKLHVVRDGQDALDFVLGTHLAAGLVQQRREEERQ